MPRFSKSRALTDRDQAILTLCAVWLVGLGVISLFHRLRTHPDVSQALAADLLLTVAVPLCYSHQRDPNEPPPMPEDGRCPKCGYDLQQSPNRCPEWGYLPNARIDL